MSLINQMLKDLSNRSKPVTNPEALLSELMERIKIQKNKYKIDWAIYGTIIFLMIIISGFIIHKLLNNNSAKMGPRIVATTQTKTKYPPNVLHESTMITGITLEANNQMTILSFLLDKDVSYRVQSESKNEVQIAFDNAKLVASLPSMNPLNSGIKMIRVSQVNHVLIMHLSLMEGITLSHLDLHHVKGLPELQIEFNHKILKKEKEKNVTLSLQTNKIKKAIAYSKEDEYEEARTLSTQGRNNEAIRNLTNVLENDPEFFPARNLLATILFEQGNFENATAVLKTGLQQKPFYPPYVQLEAQILMMKGKLDEALNLLQTAPPTLNKYPEYHALIAALYQRVGKPIYAEGLYEQLLKLQPENSIWWLGLGIARESMNKKLEALEAFANANTDSLTPELRTYVESRINHLQG